jgi:hypothetical protein
MSKNDSSSVPIRIRHPSVMNEQLTVEVLAKMSDK